MKPTRRSFFASVAALVVAPKVLKPPMTATEAYIANRFDRPYGLAVNGLRNLVDDGTVQAIGGSQRVTYPLLTEDHQGRVYPAYGSMEMFYVDSRTGKRVPVPKG